MGEHSKGPWRSIDEHTVVIDAFEREVADMTAEYCNPHEYRIMEANARLVAAAPEMLEALRLAAKDLFHGRSTARTYPAVLAAIAKATGRAS